MKKIFFILFLIFGLLEQSFGAEITSKTTSYNSNSTTECNGSISSISGEKYIPTNNNNSVASSGNMSCKSYIFYSGKRSNYINKNTIKSCNDISGNHSYVAKIKCYNSSNNEVSCSSSRTKYRIFCMYEFFNENVKLDTSNFSDFTIANGNPEEIKISFPFEDHNLESSINTLKFNFKIIDNSSINWYTKEKNSILSSAIEIENTDNENFNGEQRNITYDNVNTNTFKKDSNSNSKNDYLSFLYRFYNPSYIAQTTNNGFIFNTIKYDIKFNDGGQVNNKLYVFNNTNKINNSSIALIVKKNLYDISFSGNQYSSGFIEGVTQTGNIIIDKNFSGSDNNGKILLTKTGSAKNNFNGTGAINTNISNGKIIDIGLYPNDLTNTYNFYNTTNNTETKNFETFFSLNPFASDIDDIKNLQVDSYIRYEINGKVITYKGASLGGDKGQLNKGLKIYGLANISNKKQKDITTNQNNNDLHNINGHITKSKLKNSIKTKAYSIIKNIKINSTHNNGQKILIGDDYIYYNFSQGNEGKVKKLELDSGDLDTNKTIIVYGGNLFLTCNTASPTCNTNGIFFPGIIVMKDNNGNGGNLYIDPNINRIDAIIYTDKSVLSYNETYGEISPNNGGTYETLKNQLFIKGSIFSENTIGGSRMTPPRCPFFLYSNSSFSCSLDTAQKYDLNYLRRGIDNKSNSYLGDYPVIIKYNSKLQLEPPKLFYK